MTRFRWQALLLAFAVLLTACGGGGDGDQTASAGGTEGGGGGDGATQTRDLSYAVVVHDEPAGTFWGVVQNGAQAAAEELGVSVEVTGNGDPAQQADLVNSAIANNVDGIAVSLANPDAMSGPLQEAAEAGIPVVTLNSGLDNWQDLGAITHVGQDELLAGQGAGERLNEEGASLLLCAIHEVGNIALDQRCAGAEETFSGTTERVQIDINDPVASQATIRSALEANSDIDAVLTLNPDMATSAALPAVQEVGREITIATFDLGPDVLNAINEGTIAFAIDQQQYLQGYLPIVLLTLFNENLNTVGGGQPVLTGPGFVTQENAEQVIELTEQGTR